MDLYFIRHGQTDWNNLKLIQGRSDIELNEVGVSQAIKLRDNLSKLNFDKIYSSPLKRALQTAKVASLSDDIVIIDEFIERNFGYFESRYFEEYINHSQPHLMKNFESSNVMINRILNGINKINCSQGALVFTHAHVLLELLCFIDPERYNLNQTFLPNGTILHLTYKNDILNINKIIQ